MSRNQISAIKEAYMALIAGFCDSEARLLDKAFPELCLKELV